MANPFDAGVTAVRRIAGYHLPALNAEARRRICDRLMPVRTRELLPGVWVDIDLRDTTQRESWWFASVYEGRLPERILALVADASHFFDVGANCGIFAFTVARAQADTIVHAFEPEPALADKIERAVDRSGLANVHVHRVGLGAETSDLELHPGDESGHGSFGDHPAYGDRAGVVAHVVRFDEWRESASIALPEQPSWVAKIDVEGFEPNVINGMSGALEARAFSSLVVEVNGYTLAFCDSSPRALVAQLSGYGYEPATDVASLVDAGESAFDNVVFVPTPLR